MSSNFFSKNNKKCTTKNGFEYQRLLQEESNADDKENVKKGNTNFFSKIFKSSHKEEKNKEENKQIPQDEPLIQL